jgi:hypothetical protein
MCGDILAEGKKTRPSLPAIIRVYTSKISEAVHGDLLFYLYS